MLHRTAPTATTPRPHPGCGWYESSWDLSQGLQVVEHQEPGDLMTKLPLSWWLSWELRRPIAS